MERQYWWPVDLLVAAALTLLAGVVAFSGLGGIVRLIALAPLVLFLPGYGVVCAAYPRAANEYGTFDADTTGISAPEWVPDGLGGVERVVVSVVASVVLVPLVALVVTTLGVPIRTDVILVGVVALTLFGLVAAFVRRAGVSDEERFAPSPVRLGFRSARSGPLGGGGSARRYNAALVVSLLLLAASAGVAAVVPPQDSGYTEVYVTNVSVSGNATPAFPTTMTQGETATLPVTVGNHEGHDQQYTVVTTMHADSGGSRELNRRQVSVPSGETRNLSVPVTPQRSGDGLEVRVLLYRGSAPSNPTADDAYRALRLPIDFVRTARNG